MSVQSSTYNTVTTDSWCVFTNNPTNSVCTSVTQVKIKISDSEQAIYLLFLKNITKMYIIIHIFTENAWHISDNFPSGLWCPSNEILT